jgi:hypothetical protein
MGRPERAKAGELLSQFKETGAEVYAKAQKNVVRLIRSHC